MIHKTIFLPFFFIVCTFLNITSSSSRFKKNKKRENRFLIAKEETPSDVEFAAWSKLFAEVFDIMHKKHYLPLIPQESMIKALNAFVSCDPHSAFLHEKELTDMLDSTQGELCGIGVIITQKEASRDFIEIIEVIYDGPADKAGLEAGDKIIAIDTHLVEAMSMDTIAQKLKGAIGTKVKVSILRNTELKEYELIRDTIKEESLHSSFLPDSNTYYISLTTFNQPLYTDLKETLEKIISKKPKGILIDLRNNGGGLLESALDCLSLFIPKKSLVVSTKDRNGKVIETCRTNKDPLKLTALPFVLLVNNFTASAAEIFAGTLRIFAQKQGFFGPSCPPIFIIGSQTFGKGSVQELIPLTKTSALKLTTSLYYLADDSSIQSKGITPDFFIESRPPMPKENLAFIDTFGHEKSLKNALVHPEITDNNKKELAEEEIQKKNSKKKATMRRQEKIQSDNLVHQAVNLLNIYGITRKYAPEKVKTQEQAVTFLKKNIVCTEQLAIESF